MTITKLELHKIGVNAVESALEKAHQYRSLLEPEQAESICLDILAVAPNNHEAQIILILALTDQFSNMGQRRDVKRVTELVNNMGDEYERIYYRGLICERQARAMLNESMASSFTYHYFLEAVQWYEKAEKVRPKDNDDAILRYNACLRTIRRERLMPRADRDEVHLDMES